MRSSEEIAARVAETIRHVYLRPIMYTAPCNIETPLWDFHWMWAVVHGSEALFRRCKTAVCMEERAAEGLWNRFMRDHPGASDDEALVYVFTQWKKISVELGVPLENPE